jgi:hypothetical protein
MGYALVEKGNTLVINAGIPAPGGVNEYAIGGTAA